MRSLRYALLGLSLLAATPALAAEQMVTCSPEQLRGNYTPQQAVEALGKHWGEGVTLSSGSQDLIMKGFRDASHDEPGLTAEMASLIAVGRPDLMDSLRSAISDLCPTASQDLIEEIEKASTEPDADQLSAIATNEGSAPAAGGDDEGGDNGSNE